MQCVKIQEIEDKLICFPRFIPPFVHKAEVLTTTLRSHPLNSFFKNSMLVRVSNNMFNMFFNPKGSAFEFKAMNSIINLKIFNKNTMNVQEKAKREEKRR